MTNQALWFWQDTVSTPGSQFDIHVASLTSLGRILAMFAHGELSVQSGNVTPPFVTASDLLWGVQWVPSGNSPQDILTSAPGDQWFWRHMVAHNNDARQGFDTPSTTATTQVSHTLKERYQGQGNRPGGTVDIYVSFRSVFNITVSPFFTSGSLEGYWD